MLTAAPRRAAQLPPVRWSEALAFKLQVRKGIFWRLLPSLSCCAKTKGPQSATWSGGARITRIAPSKQEGSGHNPSRAGGVLWQAGANSEEAQRCGGATTWCQCSTREKAGSRSSPSFLHYSAARDTRQCRAKRSGGRANLNIDEPVAAKLAWRPSLERCEHRDR